MSRIRILVGSDHRQSVVQFLVMDACSRVLPNAPRSNDRQEIGASAEGCGDVAGVAVEACTPTADPADESVQPGR